MLFILFKALCAFKCGYFLPIMYRERIRTLEIAQMGALKEATTIVLSEWMNGVLETRRLVHSEVPLGLTRPSEEMEITVRVEFMDTGMVSNEEMSVADFVRDYLTLSSAVLPLVNLVFVKSLCVEDRAFFERIGTLRRCVWFGSNVPLSPMPTAGLASAVSRMVGERALAAEIEVAKVTRIMGGGRARAYRTRLCSRRRRSRIAARRSTNRQTRGRTGRGASRLRGSLVYGTARRRRQRH